MHLEAFVKGIFFILVLLIIMLLYQLLIRKIAKNSTKKIWIGAGAFFIFSALDLNSGVLHFITADPDLLINITNVIKLFWWLSLDYLVNQLIDYWLWNKFFLNKGIIISRILRDLVSISIMIVTIAAIVHFVYDKSVFGIFTASGVMAIILGYSAQATLSDIFAGLGLNTSKEFSEGDWIKVNENMGRVIEISWRFVKLVTKEKNYLSIPNSVISKLPIINLSSPSAVRGVTLNLPLLDTTSPAQYKKILVNAAQQCNKVLKDPPPVASLTLLREFNHLYQLIYFTVEVDESIVNDEILSIIWYMCRRQNIKTMPQDISTPELITTAVIEKFLKNTDLFRVLNTDEVSLLASGAICHYFGPPERILEQGQSNSSLFIIYSGSVDVFFTLDTPKPIFLATLQENQYFGEMSLLTGEACNASIIVKEESVIIEINHENIANVFSVRPILIEKISEIVVERKLAMENIQASMTPEKKIVQSTLLDRMVRTVKLFFHHQSSD